MPYFEYRDEEGALDPVDVKASNREAAIPLLKKAWAMYIARLKENPRISYDWAPLELFGDERVRAIGDPNLKFGPKPKCCKKMQRYTKADPRRGEDCPSIMLDVPYGGWKPEGGVQWRLKGVPIVHCPWCGEHLPAVTKLKTSPHPTCSSSTGDYCDTCEERLMGCRCNHPAAAYGIVK